MKKCAILMLAFMTMYSCKKECIEREDESYQLKSELIGSIPYQKGQVLSFDRGGEVYSFVVTAFQHDTIEDMWYTCEACCSDTIFVYEERLFVELYDSIHQFKFEFNCRGISESMFLDVYPFAVGQHANASSTISYSFDSTDNFTCNYSEVTLNGTICHDTITIGTVLYYDVAEIRHNYGWFHDVYQLFYSREKGIIKVTFRENIGVELTLVE
jgi:hypothetical protein